MTLAFYNVDNSKGYGRNTFDAFRDKPHAIKDMLEPLLDTGECVMFDMDDKFEANTFGEEWNNDNIPMESWCVVIND